MESRLSEVQLAALVAVAAVEPRFTLTGGAALAAVHLGHRETRDLDLFFHGLDVLGRVPDRIVASLHTASFSTTIEERFETFCRVLARRADEVVVIDLVADPVPVVDAPVEHDLGGVRLLVDSLREIAANKLCALVGRSELRDLVDLQMLLAAGIDLSSALGDAVAKDGGFSPLVLAWSIERFPLAKVAHAEGLTDARAEELDAFRRELAARLASLAKGE